MGKRKDSNTGNKLHSLEDLIKKDKFLKSVKSPTLRDKIEVKIPELKMSFFVKQGTTKKKQQEIKQKYIDDHNASFKNLRIKNYNEKDKGREQVD